MEPQAPDGVTRRWAGQGACPGIVVGPARPLRDVADLEQALAAVSGPDDRGSGVVIVRNARPAMVPVLRRAAGIVADGGRLLAHTPILARELGTPCVVGLAGILESIEPGALVRLDGTAGTVDLLEASVDHETGRAVTGGEPAVAARVDGRLALMQFGRFSAAFTRTGGEFDAVTCLRVAALAALPRAFADGTPWEVDVEGAVVLVAGREVRGFVDELAGALRQGRISTSALRARYDSGLAVLADLPDEASGAWAHRAAAEYLVVNQLTWIAAAVRGSVLADHEARVDALLPTLDPARRRAVFLDSLTSAGLSFLLEQPDLSGRATARRRALEVIGEHAGPDAVAAVDAGLRHLDDLVAITERKNTELARVTAALFGEPARHAALVATVGLADHHDDGDPVRRRAAVLTVLDHVRSPRTPRDGSAASW